jgi:hypothetical protein
MNDNYDFPDHQHIYGYCACPTALADEQIVASHDFRYHVVVINKVSNTENSDSVIVMTYEFSMDELVAFIHQAADKIVSIERLAFE